MTTERNAQEDRPVLYPDESQENHDWPKRTDDSLEALGLSDERRTIADIPRGDTEEGTED